jgi:hypothetical protein
VAAILSSFFWERMMCLRRRPGLPLTAGGLAAVSVGKIGLERVYGVAKLAYNRGIVR